MGTVDICSQWAAFTWLLGNEKATTNRGLGWMKEAISASMECKHSLDIDLIRDRGFAEAGLAVLLFFLFGRASDINRYHNKNC